MHMLFSSYQLVNSSPASFVRPMPCLPLTVPLSSSNISVVVSPTTSTSSGPLLSICSSISPLYSSISSALCPEWGWYTDTRRISPTFAAVVLFVIHFFCPPSSHSFRFLPLTRMAECLEWIITLNFAASPIQIKPSSSSDVISVISTTSHPRFCMWVTTLALFCSLIVIMHIFQAIIFIVLLFLLSTALFLSCFPLFLFSRLLLLLSPPVFLLPLLVPFFVLNIWDISSRLSLSPASLSSIFCPFFSGWRWFFSLGQGWDGSSPTASLCGHTPPSHCGFSFSRVPSPLICLRRCVVRLSLAVVTNML